MKRWGLPLLASVLALTASADVHVRGYTRKDGTYVAPHTRSSPNSTKSDNYSTKGGNVNPYTGKAGTKPGDGGSGAPAQSAATAPAQSAPAPTAAANPSSASGAARRVTAKLSAVTLGMTKAQVIAAVGKPNVESDTSWFYLDAGWVRFKGENVSTIEAR